MKDAMRLPFNAIFKYKDYSVSSTIEMCNTRANIIHIGCNFDFTTSKKFQAEIKKPAFLLH
jgi:hypothetical protein